MAPPIATVFNAALTAAFVAFVSESFWLSMIRMVWIECNYMEIKTVPLSQFDINPSMDDMFWQEKMFRFIKECNSVSDLKEVATLLTKIATQRQGVIRGLVKDIMIFNHVLIDDTDLANPANPKEITE